MEKEKMDQEVVQEENTTETPEKEVEKETEPVVEKSVEEIQKEKIAELTGEVDKWKTDYYKVFADMENLKKRLQNEHANALKYMLQSFAEDLLPILDNLERSQNVDNPSEEIKSFLKGYEMITKQFTEALKKHGIEHIEVEGQEFDPNLHQAVMMVSDENYGHNMIVEELQKGYKLKDRVIRASLVKVNE